MSGSFRVAHSSDPPALGRYYHARPALPAHDHVKFHMSSGAVISFNDPRRFGMMKIVPRADLDKEPQLHALGPEPLADEFNPVALARRCAGKKTSLKAALMDQNVVAGLGNIYVCEGLHRARLSPKRRASTIAARSGLPNDRARRLVDAIKAVLRAAIKSGGSSLRDHRRTDGALGEFQRNFRVYDRAGKPCPRQDCGGTIKRIVQSGRSTFFCSICQK
jgi:formamidopyrimidine-DNA glycosylase